MFATLSTLVLRRARAVVLLALILTLVAGAVGAGAVSRLRGGGFDDPSSESARATVVLEQDLGQLGANLVLLVTAPPGLDVDAAAVVQAGRAAAARLDAEPDVTVLTDYWRPRPPGESATALRSQDHRSALVVAHLAGDDDAFSRRMAVLQPAFSGVDASGVEVRTGGFAQTIADLTGQVRRDLARAEAIAIPVTLLLLVLTFGSLLVGLLPLGVGVVAMVATLAVLRVLTLVTDVSVFSLNLTLALGLGLGIDYALLIVNRFREELSRGGLSADTVDDADVQRAVATTVRTAGRTVLFSAATIAVALAALLAFPMYFLRSFAYAGIAVVAVTAATALVVLPAVLRLLGVRACARRFGRTPPSRSLWWARVAAAVTRRPVRSAIPALIVLGVLALPLSSVTFGLPDDRAASPEVSQARRVGDVLRSDFALRQADALLVALPGTAAAGTAEPAATLSRLPHVSLVDAPAGRFVQGRQVGPGDAQLSRGGGSALRVLPDVEVYSPAAQDLVAAIRSAGLPSSRLVGGPTARFVDVNAAIGSRLPLVAALIVASTLVLIFLFTGSVVLPVKALLVTTAGIGAVVGAMVWVFQQGHGATLLGFTPTPLSVSIPPLMFCLAFGLSMDYEVFLLGRIAEFHRAGLPTSQAVVEGLARTGRIVTAAAALMSVTFVAFATSEISFITMLGLGCALAVLLDATLLRGVLVPAMMQVLGRANWWAPEVLRQAHHRFGLGEDGGAAPAPHLNGQPVVLSHGHR